MITNLLASVTITLITNVVATDNSKHEQDPWIFYPERGGHTRQIAEATERYQTTNVTEHTVIVVPLPTGPATFTQDRLLSSVTAILKKLENWQPAGLRTNDALPPSNGFTITNWSWLK